MIGLLLATVIGSRSASSADLMDGWYSYDYRAGLDVEPAVNVFRASTPVDDQVWVGDRRWSIDDPESPPSVLALVRYEQWDPSSGRIEANHTTGRDLNRGCVSFDIRGRDLDLRGADLTVWVMSSTAGQRWHTILPVELNGWTSVQIDVDDADWWNSWRWDPANEPALDEVLATANSYGVGMVGFEDEPTGLLGMRNFQLSC